MVPTISTGFDCGKTHNTSLSRYCFLFRSSVTIGHVSESEKARRLIPHELNIPYGPLHKEKIDIFGTDLSDGRSTTKQNLFMTTLNCRRPSLCVRPRRLLARANLDTRHLSLYCDKSAQKRRKIDVYWVRALSQRSFDKNYRRGGSRDKEMYRLRQEAQVKVGIHHETRRSQFNSSRGVYLTGYSAGSHLVASLYTDLVKELSCEDRGVVTAAILIAGIYDLHEIPKTSVNAPLKLDAEEANKLSPYRRDIASGVKTSFYVVSAENDSPEFGKQSREFHEKLVGLGVKSTLVVCEDVDHFDVVERLKDEDFQLTKLILDLVKQ
jgi:hypothetical protein